MQRTDWPRFLFQRGKPVESIVYSTAIGAVAFARRRAVNFSSRRACSCPRLHGAPHRPAAECESPALQVKTSPAAKPRHDFTPKAQAGWDVLALVFAGVAIAATVITSQATISGAYSMTQQAIQLGYLPRMTINRTSARTMGQIHVPAVKPLHGLVSGIFRVRRCLRSYC